MNHIDHHERERRHRRFVWLGLALAVALDIVTPLTWKAGVMRLSGGTGWADWARAALGEPLLAVVLALFAVQFINWMAVLSASDVSYAQPITALSYIVVTLFAAVWMGERVTLARGAGVILILAGVWLIGSTPIKTTEPSPLHPAGAHGGG